MLRAFIAVEIDEQSKQKVLELVSCLKKSCADVKWLDETQMHLTLKFLGGVPADKINGISEALSGISGAFESFPITLSGIGVFPDLKHPAVLWLGVDKGAESLETLNDKIENALEKIGFQKEKRKFKPHLTLGRVKSSKNMPGLLKLIGNTSFEHKEDIKINELSLFQSALNPKGAIYNKLSTSFFIIRH